MIDNELIISNNNNNIIIMMKNEKMIDYDYDMMMIK